jgi:hypothetical protein
MAWYYGINHGAAQDTVTSAATTTSKDIEIVISTTAQGRTGDQRLDVDDVILAIRKIKDYVLEAGREY